MALPAGNERWPFKRLRFELEKRQRQIAILQTQLSDLDREWDEAQNEWGSAYQERASLGKGALQSFDPGTYRGRCDYLMGQINSTNAEIANLQTELDQLERVMNSK